jgi:hypothetical protein
MSADLTRVKSANIRCIRVIRVLLETTNPEGMDV